MDKAKILRRNAQNLRRNMTPQERHLWYDFLSLLPICAYRQKVILDYIVDFYVASPCTVIELDGSQHYEKEGKTSDKIRDAALKEKGCRVLRYSNSEIDRHFEGVCRDIAANLGLNYEKLTLKREDKPVKKKRTIENRYG